MATRMQQRRGTASQWTTANPVLAAGEIGYEIDTNKFKIGDGINQWDDLDYFASSDAIADLIDGAPELLDTLNELAAALDFDPNFANNLTNAFVQADFAVIANIESRLEGYEVTGTASGEVAGHNSQTENVHGIANTLMLATKEDLSNGVADAALYTDAQVLAHNLETANVHGIVNTLALATISDLAEAVSSATIDQSTLAGIGIDWDFENEQFNIDETVATTEYVTNAIADHNDLTENIHGIANTLVLATLTDVSNAQEAAEDYADGLAVNYDPAGSAANAEAYADSGIAVHNEETSNVHGIANTLALITNVGDQTIDGILTLSGLVVQGNTTVVNTTDLFVQDPLIYLASDQYDTDLVDIGFTGAYGTTGGTEENHLHTGLVRDITDAKWKLFSNVPHPVANEIDFGNAVFDTLRLGTLEPTVGVAFSDGTQSKEGVPSRTTIIQKTENYTLSSLDERDDLIEFQANTAVTVTIPLDSSVNYPVGTSIDIVQTGTGQVTIAGTGGVTVNATPGLKLRGQWSSATLFKRAANTWLVMGDLSA
jgi:hypothetical protein